jgi:hypothetical protein
MAPPKPSLSLRPAEVKLGKSLEFGGVNIDVVEVNKVEGPFGLNQWTVAYRLHDDRQAPPFVSEIAHVFATESTNLKIEFKKIVEHYEQIKHTLRR